MYLRFGRRIIVEALKSDSLAKIAIPSNEKIPPYTEAVGAMYPLLSDVWSTKDGLKLYLKQWGNTKIRACFYNGWMHGHYVTRSLFFALTGPFPLPFLMVPDLCMTAKLHIGGGCTISLVPCMTRPAGTTIPHQVIAGLSCLNNANMPRAEIGPPA